MNPSEIRSYRVQIGNSTAAVDVIKRSDSRYVCFFNQEPHKDFINALNAIGFAITITNIGGEQTDFFPIKISENTELTDSLMKEIWRAIKNDGLF